ncbi:hypothetical protein EVAR_60808_1 [Eumeta japonica]|uniref:Uncharacterized protein n=1 Tax=Eumeta variegata TaxID=151549 RepID=A0A4C1YNN3_EUMVA|nr:hypothetical protein EVAR_60808_1 [Eumeta japonica]
MILGCPTSNCDDFGSYRLDGADRSIIFYLYFGLEGFQLDILHFFSSSKAGVPGEGAHAEPAERLARAGAAAASLVAAYSDPRRPNVAAGTRALRALAQLVSVVVKDIKGCSACYPREERMRRLHLADALCAAADALCRAASVGDLEKINASSLVFGDAYSNLLYSLDKDTMETVKVCVPEQRAEPKCVCLDSDQQLPSPTE